MEKILILVLPEIRDTDRSRQNSGNQEGFVYLIHYVRQQFIFLSVGHAVLNQSLPCAGVVCLAHITGCGFIADSLSGSYHPLLEFDKTGGIRSLPLGIDGNHIISHI